MALDDGLLQAAKDARAASAESLLEADKHEQEYLEAIRRLHAAGGSAAEIAAALALGEERIRELVGEVRSPAPRRRFMRRPRRSGNLDPGAMRALRLATREAFAAGDDMLRSEYLLMGLIREGGAASAALERAGADLDRIRAALGRAR